MPSTTVERYTLEELRKDAARVAELTERGRLALNDAATIANRIADESPDGLRFTFSHAIQDAAAGISKDIAEAEVSPTKLAEYGSDLVRLVELAASAQAEEVPA